MVYILQEWEGRVKVGMSNSVTTAIRESVRDMAIGRTKTTEKADRATVEQVNKITIFFCFVFLFGVFMCFCAKGTNICSSLLYGWAFWRCLFVDCLAYCFKV